MGRRDPAHTRHAADRLQHRAPTVAVGVGRAVEQDLRGVLEVSGRASAHVDEREDGHEDEDGDDEGAHGVGDAHVVVLAVREGRERHLDEEGGEDDAHRAQRVREHVQEHAVHVVVLSVRRRGSVYVTVIMPM